MKIVHIIEATATGTLSMAALLANSQRRHGYEIAVIYSRRDETPANLYDFFDASIELVNVQMTSGRDCWGAALRIRKILQHMSPGRIFMHSSYAGFVGRLAGIFIFSSGAFYYLPHCISFMREDIGLVRKWLFLFFEWIGAIKECTYIACSESERRLISKFIPFRKCFLVENAVNFSRVSVCNKMPLQNRKCLVVTVGGIRTQKGPLDFAYIARRIRSARSDVDFLWVGDGDASLRQELEESGVKVSGWTDKDGVWNYLSSAYLYLSTALWEGMPVSVIEANLAGAFVVASGCRGNVDVVQDGVTGKIFSSVDEAIALVQEALDFPVMSQKIVENAREMALTRFSNERYFQEIEALSEVYVNG